MNCGALLSQRLRNQPSYNCVEWYAVQVAGVQQMSRKSTEALWNMCSDTDLDTASFSRNGFDRRENGE